ncbi:gluconokinase [Nocardia farcinica]|uniref:gluconokinase n=1 Tax=Nocardia farcinica TaxID=37329 RepID=UPI00378EB3C4
MGVAGSGKTTVGAALAAALNVPYAEADSFHRPDSIAKMSAGVPLTDADREPWLRRIAGWIGRHADGGVVSSSALKRRYRDVLRSGGPVWLLHLHGSRALIAERMASRTGHFMPVSLLDSQFADLEPLDGDEPGLVVDAVQSPQRIVEIAVSAFRALSA